MKKEIEITRNNRNVGFGYTSWTPEHPEKPTKPTYTGTVKTVSDAISADRTYASYQSGGTFHTTQWFVKFNGRWYPVEFESRWPSDLYLTGPFGTFGETEYLCNSIWATIEINDAASALGSIRTERKAASSRANGELGGRPKGK